MKFTTLVAVLAAVVPPALASLTINTPSNVVECQPTQFTWSGGTAPYYFYLLPAGQTTANPIQTLPDQTGTSYTWIVNEAAGTSFTAALKDSTGAIAYSDIITVAAGSSSSCLSSSAAGAASTVAGSSAAAGSTAAAGTTAASASTTSKSSATTTASGSTSTSSSAAGRLSVSSAFGVASIMGLVGAALF